MFWRQIARECGRNGTTGHVLVTGAAGFIGMHASLDLKRSGYTVIGIDNFNTYYSPKLKVARKDNLKEHGVTVVTGDINDSDLLDKLFKSCRFTHVLHLAGQPGVSYAAENPYAYIQSNVMGTVTLFEAIRRQPIPPAVVYASSSSVYGLNDKLPFSVNDPIDRPANLYAATKASVEDLAFVYNHLYGIDFVGLRFFTVYGPWGRPDMAIYKFALNILDQKPIVQYETADGQPVKRDFTYVEDIVQGIKASIEKPRKHRSPETKVYNLGNSRPEVLKKVVSLLEENLGKKAVITMKTLPSAELSETFADISDTIKDLGYHPTTGLSEGIANFVQWLKMYHGLTGGNPNASSRALSFL